MSFYIHFDQLLSTIDNQVVLWYDSTIVHRDHHSLEYHHHFLGHFQSIHFHFQSCCRNQHSTSYWIYQGSNSLKVIQFSSFFKWMCSYLIIAASIMLSPLLCGIGAGILVAYLICKQEALLIDIPLGFRVNLIISYTVLLMTTKMVTFT